MEKFDALEDIDAFCRVTVKKPTEDITEKANRSQAETTRERDFERNLVHAKGQFARLQNVEDPLIDVFEEDDHVRILVQCRCREQEVTFHPCSDGVIVCKEECQMSADGAESCENTCRKVKLQTDQLQIQNMLFIVAKCNNNNTLEAMIPKTKSNL
jgi:hypothetical protein